MTNVIDELEKRGFIDSIAGDDLRKRVDKPLKVYCGFDPTADSLHLGNMVGIMGLAWFQRFGHTPVVILGGATGMIGDPSGKSAERSLLDEKAIQNNLQGIRKNFDNILNAKASNAALFLNNLDWMNSFTFIAFLRDVGKYFRVGPMLAKDSVKSRMQSEEGMSFTEFSYQVLQGYDFLHLFEKEGVELQIGGADQWGNITAGTELIRKVRGQQAYGLTFPLLVKSDGQKFGKSEKGAVWLSPEKLSPYEFYQYLYRVTDADVIKMMKMLTFMDLSEISDYENKMKQPNYSPNTAQRRLAEEVTRIVHGEEGLQKAQRVTSGVMPGSETSLSAEMLEELAHDMPSVTLTNSDVVNAKLVDLLVKTGLQDSKGQARRLLQNGGAYLNNQQISDDARQIAAADLIDGRLLLLSIGKKNKLLVRVQG